MSTSDLKFNFLPTPSQTQALSSIEHFIVSIEQVFILNGYAGSGKTTVLKALLNHLESIGRPFVLMAPTGRAAKVIYDKTGHKASTIHKGIYSYLDIKEASENESFKYYYQLATNPHPFGTVYIIDEASMVSNNYSEGEFFRFGSGHLLSDLIAYTGVQCQNTNSKIIFVGDPCQLPPVGDNQSKALNRAYLMKKYSLNCGEAELTEVKRQSISSTILESSTLIRKAISSKYFNYFNLTNNSASIPIIRPDILLDKWSCATGSKIIITYKNKTAYDFNTQIRAMKYGEKAPPPREGDIIIIDANNYNLGVLNGEFAVIVATDAVTESRKIYLKGTPPVTLVWRKIDFVAPNIDGTEKCLHGQILENCLYNEQGNLTPDEMRALYVDFKNRHPELQPITPEFKDTIKKDPYFNCLKIKYGYAVTCHKAQGGEWDNVFIVWDYSKGFANEEFYRWAYTAMTRASSSLYNLNPPYFTPYSNMSFIDTPVQLALDQLTGRSSHFKEVPYDEHLAGIIERFGLSGEAAPLQDHCICVHMAVDERGIEMTGWQRLGYEIRYKFRKGTDTLVFRTYINGNNEFKKPFTILPPRPLAEGFQKELAEILGALSAICIVRPTDPHAAGLGPAGSWQTDIEFDPSKPYTEALYQDIRAVLSGIGIMVQSITHIDYKERYRFSRGSEVSVLDFNYNGDGFFGKIGVLPNRSNSPALLSEIKLALQAIKESGHAYQRN